MHDHGSDDIYIIVTDLKRQEMEDVTHYFKTLCESTYHRFDNLKPSLERQIELERQLLCFASLPSSTDLSTSVLRYAFNAHAQPPTTNTMFPTD